ncbi:MAG: hypothetical protein JWN79_2826 [Gemmatimonadetes bacterium]|jgi:hypothetical protein|nr:hypothetical protein [Gemmatimonadota bacterium]
MFRLPPVLAQPVASWAHLYSHSTVASTTIVFLHVGALVVGGGLAIALDRATLRHHHRDATARALHLAELGSAHRVVLGSLALAFASGVALMAADLETFVGSWVFWLKMALLALLLGNGALMNRVELRLRSDRDTERAWRLLRPIAVASIVLWLAITLAGVALASAA